MCACVCVCVGGYSLFVCFAGLLLFNFFASEGEREGKQGEDHTNAMYCHHINDSAFR